MAVALGTLCVLHVRTETNMFVANVQVDRAFPDGAVARTDVPPTATRRLAIHCFDAQMPGRRRLESMVRRVFEQRYGATVREFYPRLLGFDDGLLFLGGFHQ